VFFCLSLSIFPRFFFLSFLGSLFFFFFFSSPRDMAPPNNTRAEDSSSTGSGDGEVESSGSGSVIADDEGAPDSCLAVAIAARDAAAAAITVLNSQIASLEKTTCAHGVCGFVCAHDELAGAAAKLQDALALCLSSPVKHAIDEAGNKNTGPEGVRIAASRQRALEEIEKKFLDNANSNHLAVALDVLIAPEADHGAFWRPADASTDPRMARVLNIVRGLRQHALEHVGDHHGSPRTERWVAHLLECVAVLANIKRFKATVQRLTLLELFIIDKGCKPPGDDDKCWEKWADDEEFELLATARGGALGALSSSNLYSSTLGKPLVRHVLLKLRNWECGSDGKRPPLLPLGGLEKLSIEHAVAQQTDREFSGLAGCHSLGNLPGLLTISENPSLGKKNVASKLAQVQGIDGLASDHRLIRVFGQLVVAQSADAVKESPNPATKALELQEEADVLKSMLPEKGAPEDRCHSVARAVRLANSAVDECPDSIATDAEKTEEILSCLRVAERAVCDAVDKFGRRITRQNTDKFETFRQELQGLSDSPAAQRLIKKTQPTYTNPAVFDSCNAAIRDETRLAAFTLGYLFGSRIFKLWRKGMGVVHRSKACSRGGGRPIDIAQVPRKFMCRKCCSSNDDDLALMQAAKRVVLAFEAVEAEAASHHDGVALFAKTIVLKTGTEPTDVEILCCAVSAGHLPHLEAVVAGDGVEPETFRPICDALKARSEQRKAAQQVPAPGRGKGKEPETDAPGPETPPRTNTGNADESRSPNVLDDTIMGTP
jgi:hypothetical protein